MAETLPQQNAIPSAYGSNPCDGYSQRTPDEDNLTMRSLLDAIAETIQTQTGVETVVGGD